MPARLAKACLVVFIVLLCTTSASAIPLSEYREHVKSASENLASVGSVDKEVETHLDEILMLLPPSETVEWSGTTVTVDNRWVADAIARYREEKDVAKSFVILAELSERLDALSDRLNKLEDNTIASTRDKDKAQLEGILRRAEYANNGAGEKSAFTRLLERFFAWLRSLFGNVDRPQPTGPTPFTYVAELLVATLALAVIAYALWKFGPLMWRGSGPRKKKKREARVVLGERLEPEQTAADLLAEADALARSGQLRAAIRKGYVALLCELGDRKIVGLAQHKTNRDYLSDVRDRAQLYGDMKELTRSFENHWYGYVPAQADDWSTFRHRYHHALEGEA